MAVAALSSSAIALTASSAPTPATPQGAEAPQAFAKLVARASPDDKAQQDGARPDIPTDAESETAVAGDETDAPPESASTDAPAARPTDLLAEIEAMVAAAGQLGFSQPIAAPVAPAPTVVIPTQAEPDVAATTMSTPAMQVASMPIAAKPVTATPIAAIPAAATPVARAAVTPKAGAATPEGAMPAPPAVTTPVATNASPEAPAPALPPMGTATAQASDDKPATAARGDIATLLASLKAAVAQKEGNDMPPAMPVDSAAAPATDAAITPTPKAVAAPLTPTAPAAPEAAPAEAPVAFAVAAQVPGPAEEARPAVEAIVASHGEPAAPAAEDRPEADPSPVIAQPARGVSIAIETRTQTDAETVPVQKSEMAAAAPPSDSAPSAAPVAEAPAETAAAPVAESASPAALITPLPAAPTGESTDLVTDTAIDAPSQAEQSIERHLDLARDTRWLDRLARDISQAASQQGHLKFQLNPEHLGALTIEIANSAAGTAIRMSADTEQARAIIADAQPRLLAEVRAQGLRVAESHVDLNQQGNGGSASAQGQQQQQQQRPSADHKPFGATQNAIRDDADDSAPNDDGELYA
jgi:flagellar hook-length control protein FliK